MNNKKLLFSLIVFTGLISGCSSPLTVTESNKDTSNKGLYNTLAEPAPKTENNKDLGKMMDSDSGMMKGMMSSDKMDSNMMGTDSNMMSMMKDMMASDKIDATMMDKTQNTVLPENNTLKQTDTSVTSANHDHNH